MTSNVVYLCALGCIVKPRPDLESAHQTGHFMWHIFVELLIQTL